MQIVGLVDFNLGCSTVVLMLLLLLQLTTVFNEVECKKVA